MSSRGWFMAAAVLALGGCMHKQPVIDKAAAPQPDVGYVAGAFTVRAQSEWFAFGIVDARDREYVMPFSDVAWKGGPAEERLQMIAVPPGDYRVDFWTYNGNRKGQTEIPRTRSLGQPFSVQAGHVVLLGKFDGRIEVERQLATYSFQSQRLAADAAWRLFTEGYPGFADAPLECLLCEEPASGGPAASPARPDGGDFSAAREVTIHLYRTDGFARRMGLSAWETFDDADRMRELARATVWSPMPKTGEDEFGEEYWVLNGTNFRNGRVTFRLRDARRPSDPSPIRAFAISEGREVWINDGDPRVFFSRAAAVAARR